MFSFLKRNIQNELIFHRKYEYDRSYSTHIGFTKTNIYKMLKKFKKKSYINDNIAIESKFNGVYYPFHDLDDKFLELFEELYKDIPYVIFRSSSQESEYHYGKHSKGNYVNKYWAFVDDGHKKMSQILNNTNWINCNDKDYVRFSKEYKRLYVRGLYEFCERVPVQVGTNGELSKNFSMFINKIKEYYNNESLELSVLRYKDDDLLIRLNRDKKMKTII